MPSMLDGIVGFKLVDDGCQVAIQQPDRRQQEGNLSNIDMLLLFESQNRKQLLKSSRNQLEKTSIFTCEQAWSCHRCDIGEELQISAKGVQSRRR